MKHLTGRVFILAGIHLSFWRENLFLTVLLKYFHCWRYLLFLCLVIFLINTPPKFFEKNH